MRRPQESDANYPIPLNGISTLGESPVEVFALEPTNASFSPTKGVVCDARFHDLTTGR